MGCLVTREVRLIGLHQTCTIIHWMQHGGKDCHIFKRFLLIHRAPAPWLAWHMSSVSLQENASILIADARNLFFLNPGLVFDDKPDIQKKKNIYIYKQGYIPILQMCIPHYNCCLLKKFEETQVVASMGFVFIMPFGCSLVCSYVLYSLSDNIHWHWLF